MKNIKKRSYMFSEYGILKLLRGYTDAKACKRIIVRQGYIYHVISDVITFADSTRNTFVLYSYKSSIPCRNTQYGEFIKTPPF